jgi:uracil-DNA glycosylase
MTSNQRMALDAEIRERLAAWLRYSESLGIGSFFLDRDVPTIPAPEVPQGAIEEAPARPAAPDAMEAAATKPAARLPVSPFPTTVIPVVQSVSLFEESDRVEGDTLERIRADIGDCKRCRLHKGRTNIVFGTGNPKAELVFVGEGPGHDEDIQGLPFVGRAGKLLTQMIEAMGLRREDVYICNVVKCRPPENRTPEKDEIAICSPFLIRQIDVIRPKVIVCLGSVAAQTLLGTNQSLSRYRGEWFDYRRSRLLATYHPAYLLRNPNAKGEVWKDLQKAMVVLGLQPKKPAAQH